MEGSKSTNSVACSSILFASFALSNFSSKRFLNYASNQHGTNQYWFIINKKVQHFFVRGASSPCNGNHFLFIRLFRIQYKTRIAEACDYFLNSTPDEIARWKK